MSVSKCNMRAHARQLATVVTVDGDIDASNLQPVTAYATRYVLAEKPFVLDLSAVNSISEQGISLLFAVDDRCDAVGVEWELVATAGLPRQIPGNIRAGLVGVKIVKIAGVKGAQRQARRLNGGRAVCHRAVGHRAMLTGRRRQTGRMVGANSSPG